MEVCARRDIDRNWSQILADPSMSPLWSGRETLAVGSLGVEWGYWNVVSLKPLPSIARDRGLDEHEDGNGWGEVG